VIESPDLDVQQTLFQVSGAECEVCPLALQLWHSGSINFRLKLLAVLSFVQCPQKFGNAYFLHIYIKNE